MRYLPINLDIRNKKVVVVGGGQVAARKCPALLEAGARVTVIAPHLDSGLAELHRDGRLRHEAREYRQGDLAEAFLVFAVTDNPLVNRSVADEARARSVLADIADGPESGSFTLPALMTRGDLLIAVSTGGKSPALARVIRDQLETLYGQEYEHALEIMGNLREKLLTEKGNSAYNKQIFNELAEQLPSLIRNASDSDIENLLKKLFGPEADLTGLGYRGKDTE
jgi:precorrin-2 dehydrogenase / sirohydrochlorin ferrochelatase